MNVECLLSICVMFFFFKQKTAYEMRISDWSSDVCSSDLFEEIFQRQPMSRDELYEEKGLDCLDHDAPPKRVSMRKPDTRNTQKSESGRKTFQPSRISWS